MNKIWLKIQSSLSWMLVAVVLLFALSGTARATVSISWDFTNSPSVVGPTETITMMATATSNGIGVNLNEISITSFFVSGIDPGSLIGSENGDLNGFDNPYNIDFITNGVFVGFDAYNGIEEFVFGTLTPIDPFAPFGTFTSGPNMFVTFE